MLPFTALFIFKAFYSHLLISPGLLLVCGTMRHAGSMKTFG